MRHKNRLTSLQNTTGVSLEGQPLDNHIVDYFQTLFSTNTDKGNMVFLLNMEPRINETMDVDLFRDFTKDEICRALKQMHPTKAPDLDGMPPIFF